MSAHDSLSPGINHDFEGLQARLAKGQIHDQDFRAIARFLPANPTIFDIGANVGQSLVSFRVLFPNAVIHSFEANPLLHSALERVAGMIGGLVEVHPFGLSDTSGSFELLVPKAAGHVWLEESSLDTAYFELPWVHDKFRERGGMEALLRVKCRIEQGDSLGASPHAIKIDVEGSESRVIRGLERTIRNHLPVLLVENSDWERVTSILAGWDYLPLRYYPEADELRPFEGETTNFVYVHRSRIAVSGRPMNSLPAIPINSLLRHITPLVDALTSSTVQVIRSGHFVLGPGVAEFESAFAAYCGAPFCVGVGNGTDALELSLKALNIKAGDRVALCANAAMYGTTAVFACGAEPVYVDVDAQSATINPLELEIALSSGEHIRAVIVTHLYGRLAPMDEIVPICRKHGVAIVEDCAQSHGATDAYGRRAGSLGDVASFSFYPTKNLGALGDGGAVVTSDADIARRILRLRQYGWEGKYVNTVPGGRNSRLDEIQARMLTAMLPLLDGWNQRRRDIANRYSYKICNERIEVVPPSGPEYVGHLYVVRTDHRESLRQHLAEHGIQTDIHYPTPDHRQPMHEGLFQHVQLPVTESDAARVLTLPCFPELTDEEVTRVVQACNRF